VRNRRRGKEDVNIFIKHIKGYKTKKGKRSRTEEERMTRRMKRLKN
jgi:hypothetical protein